MLHAHTRALLDDWRRRAAGRPAPPRLELWPLTLGPLRPQLLGLGEAGAGWTVRRAGALWDELFGRPLVEAAFAELWTLRDRPLVLRAQDAARRAAEPCVLQARAQTPVGRPAAFELALLPVAGPGGAADRMLAFLQPTSPLARLGGERLVQLRLTSAEPAPSAAPSPAPAPRPAPPAAPRLVVDNTRPPPLP